LSTVFSELKIYILPVIYITSFINDSEVDVRLFSSD